MSNNESDTEDEDEEQHADNKTLDDLDDLLKRPSLDEMSVDVNGDPDEYPLIRSLARDVSRHGECHVCVEEHDDELEVRQGTTFFDFDRGLLSVRTPSGHGNLKIPMESVISWYLPHEPWH